MKLILIAVTLTSLLGCTTGKANSKLQTEQSPKKSSSTQTRPRVQESWQLKFDAALKASGEGSEGWALFSDSSMGHTGQQIVIRDSKGAYKLCYAPQTTDDCSYTNLPEQKFTNLQKATQTAAALNDRPLQVFDALNYEYVHRKWTAGNATSIKKVFFMAGSKPLEPAYEQLLSAFIDLNK